MNGRQAKVRRQLGQDRKSLRWVTVQLEDGRMTKIKVPPKHFRTHPDGNRETRRERSRKEQAIAASPRRRRFEGRSRRADAYVEYMAREAEKRELVKKAGILGAISAIAAAEPRLTAADIAEIEKGPKWRTTEGEGAVRRRSLKDGRKGYEVVGADDQIEADAR
jgi:hypothetical protein